MAHTSYVRIFELGDTVGGRDSPFAHTNFCQHVMTKAIRGDSMCHDADQLRAAVRSVATQVGCEMARLPQYAAPPRVAGTLRDSVDWRPSLGAGGHFHGVYEEVQPVGTPVPHVAMHVGAEHVGERLRAWIVNTPELTMRDLVDAPQYVQACAYAKRNGQRLLDMFGRALAPTVGESVFVARDDMHSPACRSEPRDEPYQLVSPDVDTRYNYLAALPDGRVAFYHRCTGAARATRVADPIDARYGIVVRGAAREPRAAAAGPAAIAVGINERHVRAADNGAWRSMMGRDADCALTRRTFMMHGSLGEPDVNDAAFWRYSSAGVSLDNGDTHLRPLCVLIHARGNAA